MPISQFAVRDDAVSRIGTTDGLDSTDNVTYFIIIGWLYVNEGTNVSQIVVEL